MPASRRLDIAYTTMLAELLERSLDAQFDADFSETGLFKKRTVKGRDYWYFRPSSAGRGEQKEKYVGPADDPHIAKRVEQFQSLKDDYQARRRLVSTLVREAGLFRPEPRIGNTVEALWKAGLFRLRACLVGTVAYQTYGNVLGYRIGQAAMQTGDIDIAQFHSISAAVGDTIDPIEEVLRSADRDFRPLPQLDDAAGAKRYAAPGGLRVDILTPNAGSDEFFDHPAPMPALGGAAAEPLRFLDYLIYEPIRTVMLHGGGIPVLVPQPARFAIHKLIVAARRPQGEGKSAKDLQQADQLAQAFTETGQVSELVHAYDEAIERGPRWREAIAQSLERLDNSGLKSIRAALAL